MLAGWLRSLLAVPGCCAGWLSPAQCGLAGFAVLADWLGASLSLLAVLARAAGLLGLLSLA